MGAIPNVPRQALLVDGASQLSHVHQPCPRPRSADDPWGGLVHVSFQQFYFMCFETVDAFRMVMSSY